VAVLSFTNSATEDFSEKCRVAGIGRALRFPSFVGTFDKFIRRFLILPGGIDGIQLCPEIVDSWETFGYEVRLRGRNSVQRLPGVSLELFDPIDNSIDTDRIVFRSLRNEVLQHKDEYLREAERFRRNLRLKGYLSASDARVEIVRKLDSKPWANAVGRALACRFSELIIDEAQDCNPLDLRILTWLQSCGLPISVVCDPDQAIYGFRHGSPAELSEFRDSYQAESRIPLTGNFRSSPAICAIAATLRTREIPDQSSGPAVTITHSVHIFDYEERSVPSSIGVRFEKLVDTLSLDPQKSIVLAHKRSNAMRAVGMSPPGKSGTSNLEAMAQAVSRFWCAPITGYERENVLRSVEKLILRLTGMLRNDEHPSRSVNRNRIDPRWLRRVAYELITRVPKSCDSTEDAREQWLGVLRAEVKRLGLKVPAGTSEKTFFKRPQSHWHEHLPKVAVTGICCATIHEAKGKEYDGVCVVLPPDGVESRYTSLLFDHWEKRTDYEGKRVIYVGVTRAKQLLTLAIPSSFRSRLTAILESANVKYLLSTVSSPATRAVRRGRTVRGCVGTTSQEH
jgi:hypothetical protein